MARGKCKVGTGDPKSSKKTLQKCTHPAIPSKRPVIIGILLPSIVYLGATPQQEIPNSSLMSKDKSKATPIVHIVKAAVNTPRRNVRKAKQIEDSPSNSEDEIRRQGPEINISNLLLELSYLTIEEFWNIFEDEA